MRKYLPLVAVMPLALFACSGQSEHPAAVSVYFPTGSAQLNAEGRQAVASAARDFQRANVNAVEVEGHADSVGSSAYNLTLATERAQAVTQQLAADGVPADRITIRAVGESEPAVSTPSGAPEPQNRRAVIQFD
jgi:outer membrane protein OmpA-like peptidoglycan-associated protein